MTIVELLNQPARYLKASGQLYCEARDLNWAIHVKFHSVGVTNQQEQDLLRGYLFVMGIDVDVFIHTGYCYKFAAAIS